MLLLATKSTQTTTPDKVFLIWGQVVQANQQPQYEMYTKTQHPEHNTSNYMITDNVTVIIHSQFVKPIMGYFMQSDF